MKSLKNNLHHYLQNTQTQHTLLNGNNNDVNIINSFTRIETTSSLILLTQHRIISNAYSTFYYVLDLLVFVRLLFIIFITYYLLNTLWIVV